MGADGNGPSGPSGPIIGDPGDLGIVEHEGAEASAHASEALVPVLLRDLAARVAAGETRLAFDPAVLDAALDLERLDEGAAADLRRDLKAAGVALTEWREALGRRRTARRAEQKRAAEDRARRAREAADTRRANSSASPASPASPAEPGDPHAWRAALITDRNGNPRKSFANTLTILAKDPDWRGRLAWNVKAQEIELDGVALADARVSIERASFERIHGYDPGAENFWLALHAVAQGNPVDPVADYLRGLAWDGVARLDGLAAGALGAEGPMPARMLRKWFISAVARALDPGCKVDTVLVLVGEQGARKSTFFQVLAGDHFSDSHVDLANKDAFLQFRRAWVIEWGEIERVTSRRGADEIKSLLASRYDDFRPHYGRALVRVPRACVIVGSTNQVQFLDDETGSRRFWVIRVAHEIDAAALAAARDQLWAEAVAAYRAKEPHWFEAEQEIARAATAEEHTMDSPWEQVLRAWIVEQGRADYLTTELLAALGVPIKEHDDRRLTRGLGRAMRRLGYEYRAHRVVRAGKQLGPMKAWLPRAVDGRVFGKGDAFEGNTPEVEMDPPDGDSGGEGGHNGGA